MKYIAFYIVIYCFMLAVTSKECLEVEPKLSPFKTLLACAVVSAVIEVFFVALGVLVGLIQIQFV